MSDVDKMIGLSEYLDHLNEGEAKVFSLTLIRELEDLGAVADPSATKVTDFRLGVFDSWSPITGGSGGEDSDWKGS